MHTRSKVSHIFNYQILAQSRAMPVDRNDNGWHLVGGDEEVNDEIELEAAKAEVVSIPSKLKAVIKFGYDEGWKKAFAGTDFDDWIAAVFTHTQAHYKDPSMGTEVTFEVSFLHSHVMYESL